ncbi:atpase AAA [Thermoanaerobacterium thermosaccharolyticum]|jgi:DNA replication protein DnaC|uniref:Atpase AAA n=1 Tax=Thermoanaerobacterium thermosaccharolyticum TaxID=1517 RepID=A0A223HY48_THETR|nr:atpase AAA [Thermoanaerobacterium thermosaccharolyticum]
MGRREKGEKFATCEFISKRQNVIMIGNIGTGKTHISIGLGLKDCKEGIT